MKRNTLTHLFIISIVLTWTALLSGCNSNNAPEPTETAVPIAAATESPTPIPPSPTITNTAKPTETPLPTDTATPQPTDTLEPSPTATNTSSPTPKPSDTPTATNTPALPTKTAVPPTAIPPTSPPAPPVSENAHTFPETPIQPWNADTFITYLGRIRDSFRSFNSEYQLALTTDKAFDCGTFVGWTGLWILEAPGFTDVPAEWYPLYSEYRDQLRQIVSLTAEVRPLCNAEGGEISEESSMAILAFLLDAYPRTEQMIIEANQLPR